jgi:hypothetical protein
LVVITEEGAAARLAGELRMVERCHAEPRMVERPAEPRMAERRAADPRMVERPPSR